MRIIHRPLLNTELGQASSHEYCAIPWMLDKLYNLDDWTKVAAPRTNRKGASQLAWATYKNPTMIPLIDEGHMLATYPIQD